MNRGQESELYAPIETEARSAFKRYRRCDSNYGNSSQQMAKVHAEMAELDIYRSANAWITRHGDSALSEAQIRVGQLRRAGDRDGADVCLRLIAAIQNLQTRPNQTLH